MWYRSREGRVDGSASQDTLRKRVEYGGRKGRRAHRRLVEAMVLRGPHPEFDAPIDQAPPMTPEEQEAQRRSFAHGNLALSGSQVTRQDIDRAAEELAREKTPA